TRSDPKDGRAVRLSLTEEARGLMPDCFELANHIESTICRGFSSEERDQFGDLLQRATANITDELESLENSAGEARPNPEMP
ncbi:MAG: hypothetical protein AAF191_20565, partial [Verrucomicrobiota bacterium]